VSARLASMQACMRPRCLLPSAAVRCRLFAGVCGTIHTHGSFLKPPAHGTRCLAATTPLAYPLPPIASPLACRLSSGTFNVGLMVIRPSLRAWRSMLYDHLAAHNAWQVVETSFLNFYFGGGQSADPGPQPAAGSSTRETGSEVVSITAGAQESSPLSTANNTRDDGTGSVPSRALHRHRWVLPLNYLCVAETAARYDDLTLCSTFDFSSCGRSRFKVCACAGRALRVPAGTQGSRLPLVGAHNGQGSNWENPIPCLART